MLPTKNVWVVNLTVSLDRERELVTASVFAEEQQMVEWHVEIAKRLLRAKLLILLFDLRN